MKLIAVPVPRPGRLPLYLLHLGRLWLTDALCGHFRSCRITGYVPYTWRELKIVIIPILGEKDYELASSWRPICLMCFARNIHERLVHKVSPNLYSETKPIIRLHGGWLH